MSACWNSYVSLFGWIVSFTQFIHVATGKIFVILYCWHFCWSSFSCSNSSWYNIIWIKFFFLLHGLQWFVYLFDDAHREYSCRINQFFSGFKPKIYHRLCNIKWSARFDSIELVHFLTSSIQRMHEQFLQQNKKNDAVQKKLYDEKWNTIACIGYKM